MVQHPDVDLVSICVRVPFHHQIGMAALNAGKHLFCEWPLAATTEQAQQMRDLAIRKGVRHMVGLQARGARAINRVRDLVAEGYRERPGWLSPDPAWLVGRSPKTLGPPDPKIDQPDDSSSSKLMRLVSSAVRRRARAACREPGPVNRQRACGLGHAGLGVTARTFSSPALRKVAERPRWRAISPSVGGISCGANKLITVG